MMAYGSTTSTTAAGTVPTAPLHEVTRPLDKVTRALRARIQGGGKALVPYVTGGITASWTDYLLAYADAGADAIEIGLPFSDPMLDGVTIQQASDRARARGATIERILADLSEIKVGVPLIAMTYANLVFRAGPTEFCHRLASAGVSGLIVPDLPVDEAAAVETAAAEAGIALILLAAPVTPDDRLAEIAARSRGFLYAVSLMGTTGERATLNSTATELATRVKALTDLPVLIGFGVSTPAQAAAAAKHADGVVVASALMRRVLDGATPDDLRHDVAALRAAMA
jgi:tryptophan synthase alpha chain